MVSAGSVWRKRAAAALLAAGLLQGGTVFSAMAPRSAAQESLETTPSPEAAEAQFVELINAVRVQRGLQALRVDPILTDIARKWAAVMAGRGTIGHQSEAQMRATPTNWKRLGENVGKGTDVLALARAFEGSPAHFENMVHPDFDSIGVGVVIVDGMIYVAHEFQDLRDEAPPASPAQTTPPAAPSLSTEAGPSLLALAPRPSSAQVQSGGVNAPGRSTTRTRSTRPTIRRPTVTANARTLPTTKPVTKASKVKRQAARKVTRLTRQTKTTKNAVKPVRATTTAARR